MASYLLFRNGRYLAWARLGVAVGFDSLTYTTPDGLNPADVADHEIPSGLGEFLCQVEIPE